MKNYDVIQHSLDVQGATNQLARCLSDLENHKVKLYSIKTLLAHNWKGNTANEIERRLNETEDKLMYVLNQFQNIEGDLERYRRSVDSFANQFMMMGPKY
ncbi:hypothetical protein CN268_17630 [Bacillus anthracis]|uniref:hypothetical protein n=1 Tax=Bacillus tropicus TaxID=2026188 RepID=UPI000BED88D7|nr:hypothetical protein CON09_11440 [Bacillus anthracis]PES23485.1 hypothetical protein CN488_10445 [Bacillus anthracis]PEY29380.1 hypothetical protein CN340_02990 [Bacillus anthracis]PFB60200.1 hypothetical protein CN268_17630 [Bacillus anthracis]PGR26319.1 hypothetical protein COC50_10450 [Bacillus anthracis]